MNTGSWIGWAAGLIVALALSGASTMLFSLSNEAAMLLGMALGNVVSLAGMMVGTVRWHNAKLKKVG